MTASAAVQRLREHGQGTNNPCIPLVRRAISARCHWNPPFHGWMISAGDVLAPCIHKPDETCHIHLPGHGFPLVITSIRFYLQLGSRVPAHWRPFLWLAEGRIPQVFVQAAGYLLRKLSVIIASNFAQESIMALPNWQRTPPQCRSSGGCCFFDQIRTIFLPRSPIWSCASPSSSSPSLRAATISGGCCQPGRRREFVRFPPASWSQDLGPLFSPRRHLRALGSKRTKHQVARTQRWARQP